MVHIFHSCLKKMLAWMLWNTIKLDYVNNSLTVMNGVIENQRKCWITVFAYVQYAPILVKAAWNIWAIIWNSRIVFTELEKRKDMLKNSNINRRRNSKVSKSRTAAVFLYSKIGASIGFYINRDGTIKGSTSSESTSTNEWRL